MIIKIFVYSPAHLRPDSYQSDKQAPFTKSCSNLGNCLTEVWKVGEIHLFAAVLVFTKQNPAISPHDMQGGKQ